MGSAYNVKQATPNSTPESRLNARLQIYKEYFTGRNLDTWSTDPGRARLQEHQMIFPCSVNGHQT